MTREHIIPPEETERIERTEGPPAAPEMRRRLQLPPTQRFGLAVLLLPPLLAIAGAFGGEDVRDGGRAGALAITARHPERLRQNRTGTIEIELRNEGDVPLGAVVSLSPEYLDQCIAITMTPPPHRAWAARLAPIAAGERGVMTLQFEAEGPGAHEGVVRVRTDEGDEARIPISTLVFP